MYIGEKDTCYLLIINVFPLFLYLYPSLSLFLSLYSYPPHYLVVYVANQTFI